MSRLSAVTAIRQARILELPWVDREALGGTCDGYRWSHMPGKALRDPAVLEKYRCRNTAHWRFTALEAVPGTAQAPHLGTGTSGLYCWPHLMVQTGRMAEEERIRVHLEKAGQRA